MRGYIVKNGRNEGTYSYSYAIDLKTAKALKESGIKQNKELEKMGILKKGNKVWIEKANINFCICGRLKDLEERECLRCDKLRDFIG